MKSRITDPGTPGEIQLQKITYYRPVKLPTLAQYLHQRAVKEAMATVKGKVGVTTNPDTGGLVPASALAARDVLKGLTAEKILAKFPSWKEDYERDVRGK